MKTRIVVLLLFATLAGGCAVPLGGSGGPDSIDMQKRQSPDFALLDRTGATVTLGDFRGKVLALTFIYTSCPDVCPIVTSTFGQAYDKLGDSRQKAAFAAISVDPERDTVERIGHYLDAQGLQGKMVLLTGDRPNLEKVWTDYYVAVARGTPETGPDGAGGFYDIVHSNLVYLIDAQGRQRSLIKSFTFTADQLVTEMRPIISESS
jgi:protein SCO1